MKIKVTLLTFFCVILTFFATAQNEGIEAGDSEISANGYMRTYVGGDSESNLNGYMNASYGYYFTRNFLAGIGPNVTFSTYDDETNTDFGLSVFLKYNFTYKGNVIPYAQASYYQYSFKTEDYGDDVSLTDLAFIQAGLGSKFFVMPQLAFDVQLTYGFSLAKDSEGGLIMGIFGLSYIF